MNRDQELCAMALWVEKHHGGKGWFYIAQQQDRLLAEGSLDGAAMWRDVGKRYEQLCIRESRENFAMRNLKHTSIRFKLALALMLGSCNNGPSTDELLDRIDELQTENSTLREQMESAQSLMSDAYDAADRARSAADEARSQSDRFRYEDWSYVVGDVQSSTSDAYFAADEAANAAEEASSALDF